MYSHGQDETLGTAYSDHDLEVFLEGAGLDDPEAALGDTQEKVTSARCSLDHRPPRAAGAE